MICVLTAERHVRSALSLLLRDLGYAPAFFDSLDAYTGDSAAGESRQPVLLDLGLPDPEAVITGIKTARPDTCVIAFACFHGMAHGGDPPAKPERVDGFFLLPSHADRAKARIVSALRTQTSRATVRRGIAKAPAGQLLKRPGGFFSGGAKRLPGSSEGGELKETRYLETKSPASLALLQQMRRIPAGESLILMQGKEGVEFELAARELNYQNGGDSEQLLFGDSEGLTIDGLERLEKAAVKDRRKRLCYVGRTDELSLESARHLILFLEFLNNLRNPHLRVILAHEDESEAFFREGVEAVLKPYFSRAANLRIPGLEERLEDIRPLSMAHIANLRAAHPFIRIKGLSEEAIQQLIDTRQELSHAKLCRILRNACALSQREELTPDDLRNYGEYDTSTSHLVESMADERYFPSQAAI